MISFFKRKKGAAVAAKKKVKAAPKKEKSVAPTRLLTAEGWRRMMLRKGKKNS
jgi:hypothetical protein